ncbi:MAG: sulfatase-like hydrolase/transferase [Acidimicrobiales bacterium]|nr:sulfatase-like hydrolase/transferase [Acidimicrobiales bacterium]
MAAIHQAYELDRLAPEDWAELRATYAGMVSRVDHHLGRILEAVDRAGAEDRTAVLFFPDHGEYLGDHGLVEKWIAGLEPALVHNPLIVRAPRGTWSSRRSSCSTWSPPWPSWPRSSSPTATSAAASSRCCTTPTLPTAPSPPARAASGRARRPSTTPTSPTTASTPSSATAPSWPVGPPPSAPRRGPTSTASATSTSSTTAPSTPTSATTWPLTRLTRARWPSCAPQCSTGSWPPPTPSPPRPTPGSTPSAPSGAELRGRHRHDAARRSGARQRFRRIEGTQNSWSSQSP